MQAAYTFKITFRMEPFKNISELGRQLSDSAPKPKPGKHHRCHSHPITEEEWITFVIFDYIFSASGIVLNTLQVYCLLAKQRKLTSHEIYLMSLSVAEIVRLLAEIVHMTADLNGYLRIIGDIFKLVLMTVLFISIFHLLTITLDRYFALTSPFRHRVVVTKRRVCLICMSIWLLPVAGLVTNLIADIWVKIKAKYYMTISMSLIITSGLLFILLYIMIVYKVKTRPKSLPSDNTQGPKPNKRIRRTVKMSALICMVFILFNFPLAISELMEACTKWPVIVQLMSCSLDSIVYFWMAKTGRRKKLKRNRQATTKSQESAISTLGSVSSVRGIDQDVHGNFRYINNN